MNVTDCKVQKDLKFLPVKFELKILHDDDPDFVFLEGYASTFDNLDLEGDIIQKGAFIRSLSKRIPKFLWQHKLTEPIGPIIEIFEDNKGLFFRSKLPKADSLVSGRVIPQVKAGSIDSISIGFSVVDFEIKEVDNKKIRLLKEIELWEISLVTIPANPQAIVTSIKSIVPFQDLEFPKTTDGEIDFSVVWDSSHAMQRVREFLGAQESPNDRYKNAFLFYDRDNQDNFGAYKLPIADVVNDKLMVIPRGVFASAAALRGARGGVDIPESDRDGIISNINKYYDKMGRTSPFEKGFSPFINEMGNIKEMSWFLKDFGFTNSERNALIGVIKKIDSDKNDVDTDKKEIELTNYNVELKKISDILKTG